MVFVRFRRKEAQMICCDLIGMVIGREIGAADSGPEGSLLVTEFMRLSMKGRGEVQKIAPIKSHASTIGTVV